MKKLLLPLIFAAMLLCACSSRAGTPIEQLKPPASVDSPSTEAMPEVTAPITDSVADESVSTTSESATEG